MDAAKKRNRKRTRSTGERRRELRDELKRAYAIIDKLTAEIKELKNAIHPSSP